MVFNTPKNTSKQRERDADIHTSSPSLSLAYYHIHKYIHANKERQTYKSPSLSLSMYLCVSLSLLPYIMHTHTHTEVISLVYYLVHRLSARYFLKGLRSWQCQFSIDQLITPMFQTQQTTSCTWIFLQHISTFVPLPTRTLIRHS